MTKDPTRGVGLVERLITLHPPANEEAAKLMDSTRAKFMSLGRHIAKNTPEGPDQTLAIRKLHEACMAAIANIACNQDEP